MRAILLAAVAVTGCAADEPPPGYPTGFGTAADPLPSADGYSVGSHIAMPLGNTAVTNAIAQLQAFSTHGGTTLLATSVGTAPGTNLAALPTALRTKLDGWIDAELDKQKFGSLTARAAIGDIAAMATTVTSEFIVESTLIISPTGALHTLHDLNFKPSSLDVIVPIGGLSSDKIEQKPTATVSAAGALALGDEQFKLGLGDHAWQGINVAVTTKYGSDLSIISNIDCEAVATAVAAKCVSSQCVGHTTDLVAVCQLGTSTLVDSLRDALTPIVIEKLRFTSGSAHLVDDDKNGIAEKITGTWDAEVNLGTTANPMQIAFTALAD